MNSYENPGTIKADIEHTRTELTDDVDALSRKTDPRARARQALGAARGKATTAGQTVRANPKPAAATILLALAAAAGTVLTRRRKAKAKAIAARSRWSAFKRR